MISNKQVADVHEGDVKTARQHIRAACEKTSAEWIPQDAIADALFLEFIEQARCLVPYQDLIQQLEQRLRALKEHSPPGRLQ